MIQSVKRSTSVESSLYLQKIVFINIIQFILVTLQWIRYSIYNWLVLSYQIVVFFVYFFFFTKVPSRRRRIFCIYHFLHTFQLMQYKNTFFLNGYPYNNPKTRLVAYSAVRPSLQWGGVQLLFSLNKHTFLHFLCWRGEHTAKLAPSNRGSSCTTYRCQNGPTVRWERLSN